MTQITVPGRAARNNDARIIPLVCAAHFVSHFYILVLPPLFPFVLEFYGVSYTKLGLAPHRVSHQHRAVPDAGRISGRPGRRAFGAGRRAYARCGLPRSGRFDPVVWLLVGMFALFGVANGVYHPADYAIMSQLVSTKRASQAFSLHIFAGFLGTAAAPATLLLLQQALGWQGAFWRPR